MEINREKFEAAAKPLIDYLRQNHHPHVTVIVSPAGAQLLEGQMTYWENEDNKTTNAQKEAETGK